MTKTHEQFLSEIKLKNDKIEITGTYTGAINYIKAKCKRCGHEWNAKAYSLLSGRACPKCRTIRGMENNKGRTKRKTHDEFVKELNKIDDSIMVESKYISHHDLVKCLCKRCGNKWEAKAYSLLQCHGCPRCAKSGTSFMEQFIRLSFIKVLSEKDVISRDRKTIGMELDILIPKLKIAIEPGNWYLHSKFLKRDLEKRNLCKNKGIKLITIYDKFPKNKKIPFEDNCFTFEDDYNKADHIKIQELVLQLFDISGIKKKFSNDDWEQIEKQAYLNAKAKTNNDFVNEMFKINPAIHIIGNYTNANRRILVKCNKCGFEWNALPSSLLSGDGCRKCGNKKAHEKFIKRDEDIIKEILLKNPNVEIVGKYTGRHNSIKVRCKICGYTWEPIVSSLLRGSSHKSAKIMHKNIE